MVPRNDTAPHEVETLTPATPLTGVREAIGTWGGYTVPSPDKKAFHIYNYNKAGTKAVIPRDNTAPHGVEKSQWRREGYGPIPDQKDFRHPYVSRETTALLVRGNLYILYVCIKSTEQQQQQQQ